MSSKDDLVQKYAMDLKQKCGVEPDMALLEKVTVGLGPSVYNLDASSVAGSDPVELENIKKNFLVKKLGLADGPELDEAIEKVMEQYGRSNRRKHRAVVYYLLTTHFGKESVYD